MLHDAGVVYVKQTNFNKSSTPRQSSRVCVCARQCVLGVVCAVGVYVWGVCVCVCVSVLAVPGLIQFPVNSYQNVLQAALADLSLC